jgi:WD40 repeat protein
MCGTDSFKRMEISKTALCGPITAIEILSIHSEDSTSPSSLILCSQGPYLIIYSSSGTLLHSLEPLADSPTPNSISTGTHNISGLSLLSSQNIAAYGGKWMKLIHIFSGDSFAETIFQLGPMGDLILDVQELLQECSHHLLIGYAQNYIDIVNFRDGTPIATVRSTIACVLFSMTISTSASEPNRPLIASGTAFGKIILWSAPYLPSRQQEYQPSSILEGHTGVIFRMKLSHREGQRLLASVSDDRSVRVWDVTSVTAPVCLFVGWGHICRVWDVLFLENGLVTCGEDATIKLWEVDFRSAHIDFCRGRCVSTLAGHGKNVWRIALLPALLPGDPNLVISAGNDGALKLWPLEIHSVLSEKILSPPLDLPSPLCPSSLASKHESLIPEAVRVTPLVSHGNRRMNCAAGISLSPNGKSCVVVLLDGTTWFADFRDDGIRWSYVNLESFQQQSGAQSGITGVSVSWSECVAISMIRSNGLAHFAILGGGWTNAVGEQREVEVRCLLTWEAHHGKGINLWILRETQDPSATNFDLLTCSIGGLCSVFHITTSSSSHLVPEAALASSDCLNHLTHVTAGAMYSTPTNAIATAASLVQSPRGALVMIGDCRGNLSAFAMSSPHLHQDTSQGSPVSSLLRAHGLEVISCISDLCSEESCEENSVPGFCSLGHDGHLNIYSLEAHDSSLRIRIISRASCLPITAPDQLFVTNRCHGSDASVYVGGFQASEYLVWDVRKKYQLLRTEAGSWKRPHHTIVRSSSGEMSLFPSVSFAFLSPAEKNTKLTSLRSDHSTSPLRSCLPLHLGVPGNGKVSYAAALISRGISRPSLIAVGGEDGSVKLFAQSPPNFQFLQEVQMPMNAAVRALSHSPSPACDRIRGIVVAGGGKLSYAVWSYDLEPSSVSWPPLMCVLQPLCSSMMRTPTRKRNNSKRKAQEGKTRRKKSDLGASEAPVAEETVEIEAMDQEDPPAPATSPRPSPNPEDQDHRILSVSSSLSSLPSTAEQDSFFALLGDSKGLATLLSIQPALITERTHQRSSNANDADDGDSSPLGAVVVEEFHPSEYPLLANKLLSLPLSQPSHPTLLGSLELGVFGDTTGAVSLWCLGSSSLRYPSPAPSPPW